MSFLVLLLPIAFMLLVIAAFGGAIYDIFHGIVGDENPGIPVYPKPDGMSVYVKQIYRIDERNFNVLVKISYTIGEFETKYFNYSYRYIDNEWRYFTAKKTWVLINNYNLVKFIFDTSYEIFSNGRDGDNLLEERINQITWF